MSGGGRGPGGFVTGVLAGLGARILMACLLAFPRSFRRAHGAEMAEALRTELERRCSGGPWAAARYLTASGADLVRQGLRERTRRRVPDGHGSVPHVAAAGALHGVATDVRVALRNVRREPGFTAVAVTVLALGIGANAAVFSALRVAVLTPPPFPDPERLVVLDLTRSARADEPPRPMLWSLPKFETLLELGDHAFGARVGYANRSATLTGVGPATMVGLEVVTPGYFALVGREPPLGRSFAPQELSFGSAEPVAVLSWELWRERFGGSRDVIGGTVTLNGVAVRVVGVAAEGFDGITGGARLWIPMSAAGVVFSPFMVESPDAHWFHVLGRLGADTTPEAAAERMAAIGDAISQRYPARSPGRAYSGSARPLVEVHTNEQARAAVIVLALAAALLFLVACANLSGLVLTRSRRRVRDAAVRSAVGASRWRLIRASLIRSAVLAGLGGAAALLVAALGARGIAAAWPSRFVGGAGGSMRVVDPASVTVDGSVVVFAITITFAASLLIGLGPALGASRAGMSTRLRHGAGATRRGPSLWGMETRDLLVSTQVALALVLVIGAGLLAGSTRRLLEVDEGFDTDRLLTLSYALPLTNGHISETRAFHERFISRIAAMPGVEAATFGCPPLRGHCVVTRVDEIRGEPEIPPGEGLEIGVRMVDEQHFQALGIPVLRGRVFDRSDGTDERLAVVLSEMAAGRLFPDADPIGRFIRVGVSAAGKDPFAEVVGVVGDVLYSPPDQGVMPEAYFSYRDVPEHYANVTVRTTGAPLQVLPAIRSAMEAIDPTVALFRIETMDDLVARSVGDRRATMGLLGLFAAVTLLLAATGTWGVVAYSVVDRRKELGLRLALGAGGGRVLRGVISRGLRAAGLGIGAGVLAGLGSSRLLESLLWGTEPTEPVVYVLASVLLLAVVSVSSWLPARRALRVDPVEALRSE